MSSFIILTDTDDSSVFVNTENITFVKDEKDFTFVHFNGRTVDNQKSIKVKETMDDIVNMIGTMKPQLF